MSLLGELLVKLGVDSSDYVKDMGEAKKTAGTFGKDVTKSMSDVAQETKNSSFSWTELNSAIAIGGRAIDMARNAYDNIITPTIKYAAEVRNLARVSGESAESTSRLIQVADDMAVSYESLMTAARMAAQKGISMSTESMAKLSDEYLRLKPGVERATFLIDKFGRSGLEMGKLLDKGSDAIKKMSAGIEDNLIMTKKGMDDAEKYRMAVDNLGDSWFGFTVMLGNKLIPALTTVTDTLTYDLGVLQDYWESVGIITTYVGAFVTAEGTLAEKVATATAAVRDSKTPINEAATALDGMTEASGAANVRLQDTQLYADMVRGAFFDMKGATEEATKAFIIQQAMLGLDSEAQLNLGLALGIVQQKTYDTVTAILVAKDAADQNRDGMLTAAEAAGTYTDKIKSLKDQLSLLTSQKWTVGVEYWIGMPTEKKGKASGGRIAGGETVVVGERGPELFRSDTGGTIIPNSQATPGAGLASGRSGGSTINLNVSVSGSIGDPQETGRQIVPALRYALRELGVIGG